MDLNDPVRELEELAVAIQNCVTRLELLKARRAELRALIRNALAATKGFQTIPGENQTGRS